MMCMHRISFAPVLSATVRRVSCWIMLRLRLLQHLLDRPALLAAHGLRLDDLHEIAQLRHVVRVVSFVLGRLADDLVVQRMALQVLDRHDDGLLHLVAGDATDETLALFSHFTAPCCCPAASAAISRSRRMVFRRAISRRTAEIRLLSTSWPASHWKRRLNNSLYDSSSLCSSSFTSSTRISLSFMQLPPCSPRRSDRAGQ